MSDKTRLIVRKTLNQLREENPADKDVLDRFEKRLDFNLNLTGTPRISGRKPKPIEEATATKDA